jgi:hypothetical protein
MAAWPVPLFPYWGYALRLYWYSVILFPLISAADRVGCAGIIFWYPDQGQASPRVSLDHAG